VQRLSTACEPVGGTSSCLDRARQAGSPWPAHRGGVHPRRSQWLPRVPSVSSVLRGASKALLRQGTG
jgi:hypothetical protein